MEIMKTVHSYATLARSAGEHNFEDEHRSLNPANLTKHIWEHHLDKLQVNHSTAAVSSTNQNIQDTMNAEQAFMANFIKEGLWNPVIKPMQEGFNNYIAMLVIEKNLPFTFTESIILKEDFCYVDCKLIYLVPRESRIDWLSFIWRCIPI